MAQQQGGGGGGGSNDGTGPLWLIAIIGGLIWGVWFLAKGYIVKTVFYINIFQAKIIGAFTNSLDNDVYLMETAAPVKVTFAQMMDYTAHVGEFTRYPVFAILVGCAALLYFSDITLKFRKTYSMNTLRNQENHNWKQVIPVCALDLINEDVSKGPWAMAQTPMEFARAHNLLRRDDFAAEDPMRPGVIITAGLRRGDAKSVFTVQLGALWEGYDVLPIHYLALSAVFLARMNRDRDGAMALLNTINESAATGKLSFMGAKVLMKKHVGATVSQLLEGKHAYNITYIASLLESARDDGVLACSDFLWLKVYDRRLWYMLNSVGRQTAFAEVSGIYAHWKAEIALERMSIVPMVDEAVKALEEAVKEVKLSPKQMKELSR